MNNNNKILSDITVHMKYAKYINIVTAVPFNLGSFTQKLPHVNCAQIIPVINPNNAINIPVEA